MKKIFLFPSLLLLGLNTCFAEEHKSSVMNSLSKEILEINLVKLSSLVLENNFDIQLSQTGVKQSEGSFISSRGDFDFNINYNFTFDENDTPSSSSLDGGGTTANSVKSTNITHTLTLSKKLDIGTEISIPYTYLLADSQSTFRIFQKSHEPNLSVSITQPLIRPFNRGYFEKDLLSSESDWQVKIFEHRDAISEALLSALEAVFDYLEAEQKLSILKSKLTTSEENFEFTSKKKKLGQASLIDLLEAKSSFMRSKESLLSQETRVQELYQEMKTQILGSKAGEVEITLGDFDLNKFDKVDPDLKKITDKSKYQREDSKAKDLEFQAASRDESYAKTDLLPTVDFDFEMESQGLNRSLSLANDEVTALDFVSYKVGLSVARPLFNSTARGSLLISRTKRKQAELELASHLRNVELEVLVGQREVETGLARIEALKSSFEAEKTKLEYYQKKFRAGQVSSFELNQHFEDKVNAEIEWLKARASYKKKLFSFYQAQGLLLKKLLPQLGDL